MGRQRFPNMGKVTLSIIESKFEDVIGKDAINEIKLPLIQKELHKALVNAATSAEKRLIDEFPNKYTIDALKQLPISTLESLETHLWEYFENPLTAQLHDVIREKISLGVPDNVDAEELAELASNYFQYFREEAVLIPEIAQKLTPLSIIRTENYAKRSFEYLANSEKQKEKKNLPRSYDDYLKFLIKELNEWKNRYAPMFGKFKDFTLFARVTRKENKLDAQELIDLIHRNDKLVIIGPAGSGKTTTLKKVALDNALNFLQHKLNSYIPIIVPLRDYGAVDLKGIIGSIIKPWSLALEGVEQDLILGKFIIIFDGLNEVPTKYRQQCFQEIRTFTREFRSNRFLYTSRNFEYQDNWVSSDEPPIPVCEIESLTKEQIEDCIRRYFTGMKDLADKLVVELKIHDSGVWENRKSLARLAGTPLLLQMLILTFEEKKRIPKSEGELLLGFVDAILLKREPSKSAAEIDSELKKSLLSTIAWEMHQSEFSSIEKRQVFPIFLRRLSELKKSGKAKKSYDANKIWQELQNNYLLIEDNGLVYWPHPLYQELFVGIALRDACFGDNWEPNINEIYLQFRPIEAKYGGISFEAGIRMLEVVPQSSRLNTLVVIATVNSSLAKEAFLRFEPEHNLGMMDDLSSVMKASLLSNKWNGESHRNILVAASYISHDYFCSLFIDCATLCPTWEGRDQSALFLWSRCEKNLALETLKNLCEKDIDARVRKTSFNLLVRSDDVLDEKISLFLIQRLFLENLGFLSDPQLHSQKLLDSEYVVHMLVDFAKRNDSLNNKIRAIWCLGKSDLANPTAQTALVEFAKKSVNEDIRCESAVALSAYPSDSTVKVLRDAVKNDKVINVRINATNSLHAIGGAKVISCIVPVLDDSDDSVVDNAVNTLVDLSKKEKRVSGALLRYLKQAVAKNKVLLTLSRITINETSPKIQKKICRELSFHKNEHDKSVLLEIAQALRSYDLSLSNEIMRELSNDNDKIIRENARVILGDWEIEL